MSLQSNKHNNIMYKPKAEYQRLGSYQWGHISAVVS